MPLPNEKPATAVFDKGRRGNPIAGCDCVQCFGYCMIDGEAQERLTRQTKEERDNGPEARSKTPH